MDWMHEHRCISYPKVLRGTERDAAAALVACLTLSFNHLFALLIDSYSALHVIFCVITSSFSVTEHYLDSAVE